MNVVFSEDEMKKFLEEATRVSQVVSYFLLVTFTSSVNCYLVLYVVFLCTGCFSFFFSSLLPIILPNTEMTKRKCIELYLDPWG